MGVQGPPEETVKVEDPWMRTEAQLSSPYLCTRPSTVARDSAGGGGQWWWRSGQSPLSGKVRGPGKGLVGDLPVSGSHPHSLSKRFTDKA